MGGMHRVVVARVAEPGTATEPERFCALGVEPRDLKESDQASCWSSGPRGFKSHPGRLSNPLALSFLLSQTLAWSFVNRSCDHGYRSTRQSNQALGEGDAHLTERIGPTTVYWICRRSSVYHSMKGGQLTKRKQVMLEILTLSTSEPP